MPSDIATFMLHLAIDHEWSRITSVTNAASEGVKYI